jgi:uncharacterized protein (DUF1501 family)
MTTRAAFIAANRFGLGARPGELGAIAGDPRGWLEQQIAASAPIPAALQGLGSGAEHTITLQKARQRGDAALQMELREGIRQSYVAEAAARTRAQIESDAPFRERLVAFWSNHFTVSVQRPVILGLAGALKSLADALVALKSGLGPAWRDTVIAVVTEFGRTVAINGTNGTDHGTAGAAFLLGGSVNGGRVVARWPGLGPGQLFEGRDLAPTTDLRAVIKGVLVDHLALPRDALERRVFPDSESAVPLGDLVRA